MNSDRKGALRDERSSLFTHVPRVRDLLRRHFAGVDLARLFVVIACWLPMFARFVAMLVVQVQIFEMRICSMIMGI